MFKEAAVIPAFPPSEINKGILYLEKAEKKTY